VEKGELMKRLSILIFVLLLLILTACNPSRPTKDANTPTSSPVVESLPATPTNTAAPVRAKLPTPTLQKVETMASPASPEALEAQSVGLPTSTLFDLSWDDRTPFAAGLLDTEQAVLAQLAGASVYHIELNIAPDMTRLEGREEVRYTNQEDVTLNEIVFRLFPNLLDGRSLVSNLKVSNRPVEPVYSLADSAMQAPLPQPLAPGEQIVIQMDFIVEVPTDEGNNYASFAFLDEILALAHFYPMIAVYDDEGWNAEIPSPYGDVVYADSGFFLVRVTAPADQIVVGSGIEIETKTDNDAQTITFAAGPMRDFYLVSSNRYEIITKTVGQTTINSYAPPEVSESAEMALSYVVGAMESFNLRFGPYPFIELDLAATPTLAGGIEYPGAIVIALSLYERRGAFFEAATAHEVGHQWFYSVVGNDQIDEPWLDEAVVQYATWLYYRDVYGAPGDQGFRQAMEGRWERVGWADIPIGLSVDDYTGEDYGAIVYGRGPLFLDALAQTMGQETLDAFLRDYYQTYRWGNVTTADFKQLAEQHCACDLTTLFEEWVYEKD
jgi:hypothetical protein